VGLLYLITITTFAFWLVQNHMENGSTGWCLYFTNKVATLCRITFVIGIAVIYIQLRISNHFLSLTSYWVVIMWWAFCLRIGSRLAPLQAWPVCFPFYRSLCEATVCRLATLGKVKGQGVALKFPFGFWFSYPSLVFLVSSRQLLGSLTGRARSRRLHLQLFSLRRLRRCPGYVLR